MTPGRALALIRVTAIPVFFGAERLVDHPATNTGPFEALLALAAVYAVATLAADLRGLRLPGGILAVVDLLVIAALVATSGGPFSQLRYAFFVLPVGAALLLRPGLTALASVACVALYTLIALTFPDADQVRPDATGFELTQVLYLVWMGAAATLLSMLLTRRTREVAALAASRGRLVAQALEAEDAARRRLAEALHDEPLQDVLAARQLLGAGDAELAREGLDRAATQLREVMFDLHPSLLERGGLGAAVRELAARAARRGGFRVDVEVEPAAEGVHDALLFALARELLANAARHAGAAHVQVSARRGETSVELTVADDGRGIDPAAVDAALDEGHIGLATCRERTEALGGRFHVAPAPDGRGTIARASVPA